MSTRRTLIAAVTAAGLALGAAGCSDDDASTASSTTLTPTTTTDGGDTTTTTAAAADDRPDLTTPVALREVATVDGPVAFASRTGTETVYVAGRSGLVTALAPAPDGMLRAFEEPVLDLRDDVGAEGLEQGLLGLAFDPDGTHLVVCFTDPAGDSVVARYEMSGDTAVVDSKQVLLTLDQPFPNHNGGNVVFGPDGYLYVGFGDGGNQGDPDDNGQDPSTLLATILRIDPSAPEGDRPYRIPADNPFADGQGGARPEVWLYGVRNPWRFSFDRATGDLWVADVGGSRYEEVTLLRAADGGGRGANLGWNLREGAHDTDEDGDRPADLVDPIHEYDHDRGVSITGGYVYRGEAIEGLRGAYLFSDWGRSTLRALVPDGDALVDSVDLTVAGPELTQASAFGQDEQGELYVLSLTGSIFRIEPTSGGVAPLDPS